MNRKIYFTILMLGFSVCANIWAQTVSNVVAKQVGSTVEITYDLDKNAEISLLLSQDGGATYSETPKSLNGDVGAVKKGHKKIVWNILNDGADWDIPRARFKIEEKKMEYVDLGLPSGTLWKEENEDCGLITYGEAIASYGSKLPTEEQYDELRDKCKMVWMGNGYKVIGPSGESIFLPAAGVSDCDGKVRDIGRYTGFWSFVNPNSRDGWVWCSVFNSNGGYNGVHRGGCFGLPVRLVR